MGTIDHEELYLSGEIAASTDQAVTFIPLANEQVYLNQFLGNSVYDKASAVFVCWDYGEVGETIIWSTKGNEKNDRNTDLNILVGVGNGAKKAGLVLRNGEATRALLMSAKTTFKVITP